MGKLSRGFLGGFQGQVGTAYGCFWRLMDLIKAMPRKSNKPATVKQLAVQQKLTLITGFTAWLASIIESAFKEGKSNRSPMNSAVSYNLEHAISGSYPSFTINYSKIKFSNGKLSPAYNLGMTADVAELKLVWALDLPGTPESFATDKASFVVYNPLKEKFVVLKEMATRDDLGYDISVPSGWSGDTVHCWMCFVKEDGSMSSVTDYAGPIAVL